MLNGVSGADLLEQWQALCPLADALRSVAPRPVLLVAAENDRIFPPSQYAEAIAAFANVRLVRNAESDHGFSGCRPWLVRTVIDWLLALPTA
jgi:hypothetical protein